MDRWMGSEIQVQIAGWIERYENVQIDGQIVQMGEQMDGQIDGWEDRQIVGQIDGGMDTGQIYRWMERQKMDGWIDGRMDRWQDGQMQQS